MTEEGTTEQVNWWDKPQYRVAFAGVLIAIITLLTLIVGDLVGDEEDPPPTSTTTTTTTEEPTTTTSEATTTSTTEATTTTTQAPTTTVPPDEYPDIPADYNLADHLRPGWGTSAGSPAFRMFCWASHVGFTDPILAPGNDQFMHLHHFFGNTGADENSTWASLRGSGDSTCQGGPLNRTAYWFPAVFDSQGRVVTPTRYELYYKAEEAGRQNVQPYPNGLRMIGGAGWGGVPGVTHSMGQASQGGTMRMTVRFPYCWNGEDLWLPDGSHMSYGVNNTFGRCPASHPVQLPELTEHADFVNVHENTSSWRLSSDLMANAPRGSTLHADWFGAWDPDVLDWMVTCLRNGRDMSGGNLCAIPGRAQQQLAPWPIPTLSASERLLTGWTPTP